MYDAVVTASVEVARCARIGCGVYSGDVREGT